MTDQKELKMEELNEVVGGSSMNGSSGVTVREEDCIACGCCENECPMDALFFDGNCYRVNPDLCIECYSCYEVCPTGAIEYH